MNLRWNEAVAVGASWDLGPRKVQKHFRNSHVEQKISAKRLIGELRKSVASGDRRPVSGGRFAGRQRDQIEARLHGRRHAQGDPALREHVSLRYVCATARI